jgi:hypothetical protein
MGSINNIVTIKLLCFDLLTCTFIKFPHSALYHTILYSFILLSVHLKFRERPTINPIILYYLSHCDFFKE